MKLKYSIVHDISKESSNCYVENNFIGFVLRIYKLMKKYNGCRMKLKVLIYAS